MTDHPNAMIARKILDAFDSGDVADVEGLLADDIIWHEIGRAEPRRGKAEFMEVAPDAVDYEIKVAVHDVVANDDHTIALVDATATRAGKTLHYRTAEIMHIRDGKVRERWAFSDDTAAIIAFFA